MKEIEKSLVNYINGIVVTIDESQLFFYADNNPNDVVNIIFQVINSKLDDYIGEESLSRTRDVLRLIPKIMSRDADVNKKIIYRKLKKLYEKLDRLISENKNKIVDSERIYQQFEKIREEIDTIEPLLTSKNDKQYSLIWCLISEIKNISQLEYTFEKKPHLVNVKDSNGYSLIRNVVSKYIDAIISCNDDQLYYANVITLLVSRKNFTLPDAERKKIIEIINREIEKINQDKKKKKKSKAKLDSLDSLDSLLKLIKGNLEKSNVYDIASKYGINIKFNESILAAVNENRTANSELLNTLLDIDEHIISIDKSTSIIIDDGLSCKKLENGNYLLGIHAASVLSYFSYESEIVQEAINRGSSINLAMKYQNKDGDFKKVIPIFPYDFCVSVASLKVGVPRLVRSYYYEIDSTGEVVNQSFGKSRIVLSEQISIENVDYILLHGSNDSKLQETIFNLAKVADLIEKRYKPDEFYEMVKENTEDYSDLRVKNVGAQKIVYYAMLLAGNRVGNFFGENGYPCLYKVHEVNKENAAKLQAMIKGLIETYGEDQYKVLYQLIDGIYPRGRYDTSGRHDGLNLDHYCHCAAELRRSADIVVEHGLEVCHDKVPTDSELKALEAEVSRAAEVINSKQKHIEWFVKEAHKTYRK